MKFAIALLLKTIYVDTDMESAIYVNVIAYSSELNCGGICIYFITAGGRL